jgi:hypothetical protein
MKYNSECVFEVIGDYPVVDQFEVSYPSLLSGSMQDNYITGSMFYIVLLGGPNPVVIQGDRGLAFSKLGVDQTSKPAGTYSLIEPQKISYVTQPWYERAGTLKNTKIFSDSERYYDSCPPKFDQIIKNLGGELYLGTVGGNPTILLFIGRGATQFYVNGFNESFPFEPKFSSSDRMLENLKLFTAEKDSSGNPILPKTLNSLLVFSHVGFSNPPTTNEYLLWRSVTPEDYSKLFFGFGDLKTQEFDLINTASYKSVDTPTWRSIDFSGFFAQAFGPVIRGWKYGLVSGIPKHTGAVFRRNRFGQFRDMLEQREIPVGIQDYEYSPFRYLGAVEQPALPKFDLQIPNNPTVDIMEYTVEVKFLRKNYSSATKTISYDYGINPEQTMSSNLSMHATSSLPFFDDGKARNRNSIPDKLIGNNIQIGLALDLNNTIIT